MSTQKGYFRASVKENSIKKNEDQGFLDLVLIISKEGILEYYNWSEDKITREYLPAEELFAEESINSGNMAPVTDGHPWESLLTPQNYNEYMKGTTGSDTKRNEEDYLEVSARIYDEELQAYILSGKKKECSIGYTCTEDWTPGEWNGQKYDLVQRNIRINHVAMCREGRAGSDVAAKLNSRDGITYKKNEEDKKMAKVKLNGKDYEVSEEVATEVEKLNTKVSDIEKEKNTVDGKLEAEKINSKNLQTKVTNLETKVNGYEEKEKEAKFNSLKEEASGLIGEEEVAEKKNSVEVMEAVIQKANSEYSAEGKAEETVRATYEGVVAGLKVNGWDAGNIGLTEKKNETDEKLNEWGGIR